MTSIAGSTIAKARFFLDCADGVGKNERVSFCNHLEAARSVCQREPRPRLAANSRARRVPTLVHKGFYLSESSAISESQARRYSQSKRGRLSSARRKAFCHSSLTAA